MSSLDQAFIKAYQGHGESAAGGPAEAAKTVPLDDAFSEPPTGQDASEPAIVPLDAVLETLSAQPRTSPQIAPSKPARLRPEAEEALSGEASPELDAQDIPADAVPAPARGKARARTALLRVWSEEGQQAQPEEKPTPRRAPQLDELDLPEVVPLPGVRPTEDQPAPSSDEPETANGPDAGAESESDAASFQTTADSKATVGPQTSTPSKATPACSDRPAEGETEPAGRTQPSRQTPQEQVSAESAHHAAAQCASPCGATSEAPGRSAGLQPMLQVDYFHWPRLCRRLAGVAGEELERLAGWIEQATTEGRKVIAFAAHQRGEGATSLLLAAARRLAARGLRLVMVDADFSRPQLAARLGLVPQVGWEAVLAGRAELAEALIESIEDRLALLPVRDAFAGAGLPLGHEAAVGQSLEQLAAAADLVLVDVGPLREQAVLEGLLLRAMGPALDALVLVENVAATAGNRRADIEHRLSAAGVPVAGVVENLVRRA